MKNPAKRSAVIKPSEGEMVAEFGSVAEDGREFKNYSSGFSTARVPCIIKGFMIQGAIR